MGSCYALNNDFEPTFLVKKKRRKTTKTTKHILVCTYQICTFILLSYVFFASTDNEPPQIIDCPSDITIIVSPGETSATATWVAPTATDNDGIKTFISNYESPHVFNLGNREVVYVANDNTGNFADCSFVVTVTGMCCFIFLKVYCISLSSLIKKVWIFPRCTKQCFVLFCFVLFFGGRGM